MDMQNAEGQEKKGEREISPSAFFGYRHSEYEEQQKKDSYLQQNYGQKKEFGNPGDDKEGDIEYCICQMPKPKGQEHCNSCEGKNSIHIEGAIYKKQKKAGDIKKYWFVLLGKEMYQYKQKNEIQHKEMHSLSGVYIKEELPEEMIDGKTYY